MLRGEAKDIHLRDSIFEANIARKGGGIGVRSVDSLEVRNCRFFNNIAIGAAMYVEAGFNRIFGNKIYANQSPTTGSALLFTNTARGIVQRNQISSNEVQDPEQGGTITFVRDADVQIGGVPGLGNDIFNKFGGRWGNALIHLGGGQQKIDARYNYFATRQIDESLIVPFERFQFVPMRDNPIASNNPPAILQTTPLAGTFSAAPGEIIHFEVSAIDFDAQPLTFIWLVNGDGVSRDTSYTHTARSTTGTDLVELQVNDGTFTTTVNWQIETVVSAVKNADSRLPDKFKLYQNFPNPFNPATHIVFDLPQPANVDLRIFDINGRLVRHLISRHMAAGQHKIIWPANDERDRPVGSGNYFVQIRAGNFVGRVKIALVR